MRSNIKEGVENHESQYGALNDLSKITILQLPFKQSPFCEELPK
jgi:hypothetical protein